MAHADFVHLRVHSAYSLSEGAIKVKDLVGLCRQHQMPAVAMTDSGNLFGALEFAVTAADAGIQPIVGCQFNLRRPGDAAAGATLPPPDHLVLLCQSETGYRNLMALVSRAYLESDPGVTPQLALEELAGSTDGLIALTGGPSGTVGRLLAAGQTAQAEEVLGRLEALFPGRLYVELQRHALPVERRIEDPLLDLAYARDLPIVATNDCYFADAAMHEAHEALLCIADGMTMSNGQRRRVTAEHRFKTAAEMRALFADLPEAIDNTLVIARRCAFMPAKRKEILPAFTADSGREEADELRHQARAGLEGRLARHVFTGGMDETAREAAAKPYRDRLEMELGVIIQMGFPGYFLIVADFIQWAKSQGIPVGPGRGSGAGSVVAWSLLITDLDPLRWGLLFERFLNPERVSMPDFDVDFCQDRRDEVIRYVQARYGRDRVAQIITFGKLQARAVLRDVGRVLEMPYGQVDRICKLVPHNPANPPTLAQALEGEEELRRQRDGDEAVGRMIGIGLKLEGLYRHASTHAAGLVIGDRPLAELVPLYRDPRSEMPVTQFNMKWVEQAGLVKFDFLGLKTLTVLVMAAELLRRRGVELDLSALPLDDERTFAMLSRGETTGVFQLEGSGMRDMLRRLQPDRFEDIIAVVALYRPGPMNNIPSYINRKHGREKPEYLYPTLEPILKETFGIIVYQEQVMQIAQVLSGYTLGGADLLRRAMGKKIKAEMEAQRKTFVDGAVARGVPEARASEIFDLVDRFAGYGFNKSHAAAYALVAYQTAYLKANYPVEFIAASMTYDMGSTDKLNIFRQEMDRLRIALLPPDINRSRARFSVEDGADGRPGVRYALAAIKNVGAQAMEGMVAERDATGPFRDLDDFAGRVDVRQVNKRQLESLVAAGAFDALMANRARLFEAIDQLLRHAHAASSARESSQVSLFGGEAAALSRFAPAERPDWSPMDRLRHEYDAIGFYLSAHPLDAYGKALERLEVVSSDALAGLLARRGGAARVNLAGIVVGKREGTSSRGNRYAFVQLSDRVGVFEVGLFSEVLSASRQQLDSGTPLLVRADARLDGETARINAQSIQLLDEAVAGTAAGLVVYLKDVTPVQPLASLFKTEKRGRGRVRLVLDTEAEEVEMALPGGFAISAGLRAAVKSLPGVVDVRDV